MPTIFRARERRWAQRYEKSKMRLRMRKIMTQLIVGVLFYFSLTSPSMSCTFSSSLRTAEMSGSSRICKSFENKVNHEDEVELARVCLVGVALVVIDGVVV